MHAESNTGTSRTWISKAAPALLAGAMALAGSGCWVGRPRPLPAASPGAISGGVIAKQNIAAQRPLPEPVAPGAGIPRAGSGHLFHRLLAQDGQAPAGGSCPYCRQ